MTAATDRVWTGAIEQEYYRRADKAANRLASVELQCQWLREIGFERLDCFFKLFELALFGGIRPGHRSLAAYSRE